MQFEEYLKYDENSRGNLGEELPVIVYRMLEYSLKEELIRRYGKDEQVEVFRSAGKMAGEYFARNMLNMEQPLDAFVNELQKKMRDMKIGVLRIEDVDEESGKIVLTVAEDADCSGLPVLGETVCNYDEGFISGILSTYSGKPYTAIEVDCWATGDRVCRFHATVKE
ncbi:4-vinyl reductase [Blautia sp. MSJ-19]|nr:4-vinyl reductase [Blautia sp. MSJ-19]